MNKRTKKWALLASVAFLPFFSNSVFADEATSSSDTKVAASGPSDTATAPTDTATEAPARHHKSKLARKKSDKETKVLAFKSDIDKISYIIGHQIAASIANDDLKINADELIKAFKEGLRGVESKIPQHEAQTFMQQYFMAQQKVRGEKNLKEGQAFLDENKKEAGVVTLPSGLQYKVVTEGTGKKPTATDSVTVNYEGTLINGKVFDSSYQRGQPVTFPVNGVIKGWTEALQLMPEGSTWMVYIPASLAYGARAPSPAIGPNQTLIFKVNLAKVNEPGADKTKSASATQPAADSTVQKK